MPSACQVVTQDLLHSSLCPIKRLTIFHLVSQPGTACTMEMILFTIPGTSSATAPDTERLRPGSPVS